MVTLREFRINSRGGSVAVDHLAGEGTPWVFLHGLASARNGTKGNAILEHARQRGRTCYRLDFSGHGESDGHLGAVTISDLCADAIALLEHSGPATLIGSSLGGLVAAWTAATRPDLVHKLALIAPAFGVIPRWMRAPELATVATVSYDDTPSCTLAIGRHVLDDARQFDEDELPERLTMPVLAIHGADDEVVEAFATASLFERLPHRGKELWVVPAADHSLIAHLPAVLDRIDRFSQRG